MLENDDLNTIISADQIKSQFSNIKEIINLQTAEFNSYSSQNLLN